MYLVFCHKHVYFHWCGRMSLMQCVCVLEEAIHLGALVKASEQSRCLDRFCEWLWRRDVFSLLEKLSFVCVYVYTWCSRGIMVDFLLWRAGLAFPLTKIRWYYLFLYNIKATENKLLKWEKCVLTMFLLNVNKLSGVSGWWYRKLPTVGVLLHL